MSVSVSNATAINIITNTVAAYVDNVSSNVSFASIDGNLYITSGDRVYVEYGSFTPDYEVTAESQHVELETGDFVLLPDGYADPDYDFTTGVSQEVNLAYGENVLDIATGNIYKFLVPRFITNPQPSDLLDLNAENFADTSRWIEISGQEARIYQYAGPDTIYIPDDEPAMKSIHDLILRLSIMMDRVIGYWSRH